MTTDESRNMKDISASEYIRTNFHPSDRIAVLVRNGGTGETLQLIATAERIAGTPAQKWLQQKNEKEACDIYIGMNTLNPEARTPLFHSCAGAIPERKFPRSVQSRDTLDRF